MSENKGRVLLSFSHDARGRPFKIDEMRTERALNFAAYGSARLDPGWDATQSMDASAPVIGRLFLESDSTQGRSLEGRPLAMYSSLRLLDRSRLRLLNSRQRSAAAFGEQKRPDVRPQRAPRAGVTTSPVSSLAQEKEGRMRLATRELEKWKNDRL
ncbi:MAG TPA: hypothetical protein VE201_08880 [Nitrospirales bacterium]|nr:hypothetical protein [Nitrospirales bacterium]